MRARARFEEGERQYRPRRLARTPPSSSPTRWTSRPGATRRDAPGGALPASPTRSAGRGSAARRACATPSYLALGDAGAPARDAVSGALDCAVKERRQADVDRAPRRGGARLRRRAARRRSATSRRRRSSSGRTSPRAERIAAARPPRSRRSGRRSSCRPGTSWASSRSSRQNLHGSLAVVRRAARAPSRRTRATAEVRELCQPRARPRPRADGERARGARLVPRRSRGSRRASPRRCYELGAGPT